MTAWPSFLPAAQRRSLIEKIRALGSSYFQVRPLLTTPGSPGENKQLFLNVELLDEAIRQGKKISALYLACDTEKHLHPRLDENGFQRLYRLNPYRMLMNDGRYYLICNNDKYDDLAHYRIDRLSGAQILEENARPLRRAGSGSAHRHPRARLHVFRQRRARRSPAA